MGHVDSAPDVFRNLRVRLEEVRDRAIHKLETDLQRWRCVDLREWLGAQQPVPVRVTSAQGSKRPITNKRGFTTSREILIVAVPAKVKYLCEDLTTVSCCSALWARILGVARSSSTCLKAVKTVWRHLAMVVHVVLEYNRLQLKPV